jgi:hypothetical protein
MLRPYDENQRRTAALIQRDNPLWLVVWGVGSRRYWAFPAFDVPPRTVVSAADPDDLVTRMRETEMQYLPPPYRRPALPSA